MYNEDSFLTKGKYKLRRIKDVPPEYLITLYENINGCFDQDLKVYLLNNIESIKEKLTLKNNGVVFPPTIVPFICDKKTFATEKDARLSLKKIRESKGDNQKPQRVYECPKCSGWHLTSKSVEEYRETKMLHSEQNDAVSDKTMPNSSATAY